MEFDEMTEIQKNVINLIDEGNDVMACSKTGSGKTIAFLLPVINKLLHSKPLTLDILCSNLSLQQAPDTLVSHNF